MEPQLQQYKVVKVHTRTTMALQAFRFVVGAIVVQKQDLGRQDTYFEHSIVASQIVAAIDLKQPYTAIVKVRVVIKLNPDP